MKRYIRYYSILGSLLLMGSIMPVKADSTLVIGVKEAPPFIQYMAEDQVTGLSIDFWNLVNTDLEIEARFVKFKDVKTLLEALESGEVDMSINPVTVTDQRMRFLDFSQPFFISGTATVRPAEHRWWVVIKNIFSWQFWSAVLLLLLILSIFGFWMWILERKGNPEQFKKGWTGLGDGIWWSAVTMTTVGYGDKAPLTRGGRILGLVWMFAAILMISGLTAGIASALTVSSIQSSIGQVEDLRRFKTGTVGGSSSEDYLNMFGVEATRYLSVSEGLQAVERGELEVFVHDRPILMHYIEAENRDKLKLNPQNLKTDYYSFSFPKGSPLRDRIDPLVVRKLKSSEWSYKLHRLRDTPLPGLHR